MNSHGGPPHHGDLAEIVRQFPSFIAVYEGADLRCVLANDAALAIVGDREFVGLPLREALPEFESQRIVDLVERVHATGEPAEASEWRVQLRHPELPEPVEMFANFAAAPWRNADGSLRGVITTGNVVTDMVRARQAADAHAAASERRYAQARAEIGALQRALLPAGVPVLPRTTVSARYLVAASEQAAGGDWFEAVPVDDRWLALVVGDVVGHGLEASAAMGQLRAVLLELLETGRPLDEIVRRLDAFAGRHRSMRATTLCIALLDQVSGELRYVTLAHPPPLVIRPEADAGYLAPTGGAPLGTAAADEPVTVGTARLTSGDVLVLFTDGLVERPGRTLADGHDELLHVAVGAAENQMLPAGAPGSAAERITDQTVEVLTRSGYADDVTVLAAELRAEPVEPVELLLPSSPDQLARARRVLGEWLSSLGADGDTVYEVQLAVSEALANAIEHAHGHDPDDPTSPGIDAPIRLDVTLRPTSAVHCCVTDQGRWTDPVLGEATRGRGLALIRAVSDRLDIERAEHGTTVQFERHLSRPAAVDPVTGSGLPRAGDVPFTATVGSDSLGGTLTVSGPIDLATVERFTAAVLGAARGGEAPLTLDLAGVTHLASTGVRALYEIVRAGGRLRLWAPAGTPARLVIDLVGLGHLVAGAVDTR
ncbi:MAG: SpoIIE family protein phosphatase [Jatrophihabitans sp.]|uniref:SpoIIE family protein phosphatase n=1 Tax=Jatrophihabitans sp. TaxID=1932789 RepID=UPI003F819846